MAHSRILLFKGVYAVTEDEAAFESAMRDIYRRAARECNYRAKGFIDMLTMEGALMTAKILLRSGRIHEGFETLREKKRLDLTVEAHVLEDRFLELFTEEELAEAARRLIDCEPDFLRRSEARYRKYLTRLSS